MPTNSIDVLGIGNAIVDVIAHSTDAVLNELALPKGNMQLIEVDDIDRIYSAMGPAEEHSGGSAANTMAGIASFGGRASFIGRVADDEFGRIFTHDIRSIGVSFDSSPVSGTQPTARSLIFVTPDGERTMNTFLGISPHLDKSEITGEHIQSAAILYLEGYLFDREEAKNAFYTACDFAANAETKVALTLSDTFCVERHRSEFKKLIDDRVDILFANEEEIRALTGNDDIEGAVQSLAGDKRTVAVTCGERGSYVARGSENHQISAEEVKEVVDTTGAGDLYAAGFLFGCAQGHKIYHCARLGTIAAAEVISHIGARPEMPLLQRAKQKGLSI